MSLLFRHSSRLRLMAGASSAAAVVQSVRNKSPITQCQSLSSGSAAAASPIQLYQYKICPFCNKAKAYMDYLGIEYTAIEVCDFDIHISSSRSAHLPCLSLSLSSHSCTGESSDEK